MEKIMKSFDFENKKLTPWCDMSDREQDFINQAHAMGARVQVYCPIGWCVADDKMSRHASPYRIHPEDLTDEIKAIASCPHNEETCKCFGVVTQPVPDTPLDFENTDKTVWFNMSCREQIFIVRAHKMGARVQMYYGDEWCPIVSTFIPHDTTAYRIHPDDLTREIKAIATHPQPATDTSTVIASLDTTKLQDAVKRFDEIIKNDNTRESIGKINIGDIVTFDTHQRADGVIEFAPSEKFVKFMDQLEREQSQKFTSPLDFIKGHNWQTKDGHDVRVTHGTLYGVVDDRFNDGFDASSLKLVDAPDQRWVEKELHRRAEGGLDVGSGISVSVKHDGWAVPISDIKADQEFRAHVKIRDERNTK